MGPGVRERERERRGEAMCEEAEAQRDVCGERGDEAQRREGARRSESTRGEDAPELQSSTADVPG